MPSKIQYKLRPFLYSNSSLSLSSVCFVFHYGNVHSKQIGSGEICIGDKIV